MIGCACLWSSKLNELSKPILCPNYSLVTGIQSNKITKFPHFCSLFFHFWFNFIQKNITQNLYLQNNPLLGFYGKMNGCHCDYFLCPHFFHATACFQISMEELQCLFSFRSTRWTSREHSGFLCTTLCNITSTTLTWCVRMRWVCYTPVYWAGLWSTWAVGVTSVVFFVFFAFVGPPPDCISPGAGGRTGAGGDGPEVSGERSLGGGALWSLWRADQSSAAGLPVIQPPQR